MEHVDDSFKFCLELPKLELHAHLNGSLSDSTLRELHNLHSNDPGSDPVWSRWETVIEHGDSRTLEECFQIFDVAHSLTTTAEAVRIATQNVIKEFVEDGVVYLELRSTPKETTGVMTRAQYIEAIVDVIKENSHSIIVKLLVSINRQHGKASAEEILNATINAHNLDPKIVVGMDVSGNPRAGDFDDYLPLLNRARDKGLKISIHTAEVINHEEVEKIISFKPDRLGHATCIHPKLGGKQELWQKLLDSKIPIELCLTSNVKCKTVKSYEDHHFKYLFTAGHPIVLATDDKGVFTTSLSHEYQQAAKWYSLSTNQLWELSFNSINFIFGSEKDKNKLTALFQKQKNHGQLTK